MARLFPLRSDTPAQEGRPRVVDLEDEDADAVFGALSSTTARRIYARLNDEPGTASDVAEAIDSSIQNVRYHLEKLEGAGLVEEVDTWYSSRGNEMSVYAATDGPLIVTSDESRASQLREALSRFLGGVTVLGAASLLVQYGAAELFGPDPVSEDAAGDDFHAAGADDESNRTADDEDPVDAEDETVEEPAEDDADIATDPDPEEDLDRETSEIDDESMADESEDADDAVSEGAGDDGGTVDAVADATAATLDGFASVLSPGLAFFLGGLVVLTLVTIWWYRFHRPVAN